MDKITSQPGIQAELPFKPEKEVKVNGIEMGVMANERKTENIVRNILRDKGYFDDEGIIVEEQFSDNPKINELLKKASKSKTGGKGYPEFLVYFNDNPNDIIVIECKASVLQHSSNNIQNYDDSPKNYAVDGSLWYASFLKKEFNVTAIAVSGENQREKKISSYLWLKENYTFKEIQEKIFPTPNEIQNILLEQLQPISEEELIKKAIEYNKMLHSYSIPEVERCTVISSILISLQHKPFLISYIEYETRQNQELVDSLLEACKSVLKKNELHESKINVLLAEYSKFKTNKKFTKSTIYNKKTKKEERNSLLRDLIRSIQSNILPYVQSSAFDVLGKFYTIFIRYAGSDKKTGLVLTPTHITDFFCELSDLNEDDVVFDPCCGTAGFLVSAMNYMLKKAGYDSDKKKQIKNNQLIGIEQRPDMFSHACSNMMMRGDGKSHIINGDCFSEKEKKEVKEINPTKTFLNPPYQDQNTAEQLEFLENALNCIERNGVGVAICQMSTVVSDRKDVTNAKRRLLEKHTLKAVFSMPNDLFHPISVVTCILVFKAHCPHPSSKESFFGYFKDDGFIKRKNKGRINAFNKWEEIKSQWIDAYTNTKNIAGLCVTRKVKAEDEWCAEAYMETDYSALKDEDFVKTIKSYVAFQFLYEQDQI